MDLKTRFWRPRPSNPKSTLIHFRHGGSGNWRPLIKRFKSFLKVRQIHFKWWSKKLIIPCYSSQQYAFGKRAGGFQQCNYNTPPLLPDQRQEIESRYRRWKKGFFSKVLQDCFWNQFLKPQWRFLTSNFQYISTWDIYSPKVPSRTMWSQF